MTNKRTLNNNLSIEINVSELQGLLAGQRALVLSAPMSGLSTVAAKDYYNVVILESDLATSSVSAPDIVVYQDETAYRENTMFLETLSSHSDTIFCVNYEAMREYSKLNRQANMHMLAYLPSDDSVGSTANTVRNIVCGLNSASPGVHLAKLMGCTTIHYDGQSSHATTMNLDQIKDFVVQKDKFAPRNLVAVDRQSILTTLF